MSELEKLLLEAIEMREKLYVLSERAKRPVLEWFSCAEKAPPAHEWVFVWTTWGIKQGMYLPERSAEYGLSLPSPSCEAVWNIASYEGRNDVKYWAYLPLGPAGEV